MEPRRKSGWRARTIAGLLAIALTAGHSHAETPAPGPDPVAAIPQVPRLRPLDLTPFQTAIDALTPARAKEIHAMIATLDLSGLQQAMWDGKLTSEELTTFYLSRIARHDDALRAFLDLNPAALDEARAADAAFRDGQVRSLLQGIPVALKDNIETAGPMHTTANAAILLDNVAAQDAELVARLRASGAVILGKTSLSELAGVVSRGAPAGGSGAVGGQAMNPHGAFPTNGSSSGSAIAVAALLTHLAVGTETSGSLIAPATVAGVVALKPSAGLVPGRGIIPLIAHNDMAGPMGRSVAEVATLLAVLEGSPASTAPQFALSAFDGVTVGVLPADLMADPAKAQALSRASVALTMLGARLRPTESTDPTGEVGYFSVLIGSGIRHEVIPYIAARHPDIATPEDLIAWNAADPATRMPLGQDMLQLLAQISAQMSAADHAEMAKDLDARATEALERALAATGAEVLLSSDSTHAPFYATAGWPAVTVPLGLDATGRPIGATLIARKGQDARLLALAWALERATQARPVPALAATP